MNLQNYPENVRQVIDAVLAPGVLHNSSTALRATVMKYATALSCGQPPIVLPPTTWQPYIDTITKQAFRITDAHTEQLKAGGYNEDEIFEVTIAAALGAGLARLEQGLAVIDEANGRQS